MKPINFPWLAWKLTCLELFMLEGSNYSSPSRCKLSFVQREQEGVQKEMVGPGGQAWMEGEAGTQVVLQTQEFWATTLVGDPQGQLAFHLKSHWVREAHLKCPLCASFTTICSWCWGDPRVALPAHAGVGNSYTTK